MVALSKFRRTVPALVVLVILLFFFPVAVGSYQATHGPTSTLQEYLTGVLLQALIALVAPCGAALAARCALAEHSIIEVVPLQVSSRVPAALRC